MTPKFLQLVWSKHPSPRFLFFLFCGLIILVRFWAVEKSFQREQQVFSNSQGGLFRAWLSEEPEILFGRTEGSHDTGRLEGAYQPFVKEVRGVCTLLSLDGHPVIPVKARCTFRLSPDSPVSLLSYGDELELDGKILLPPPALNPGQLDYRQFLKNKGVAYVMYLSPSRWRRAESGGRWGNFLSRWASGLKRKSQDILYRYLPYPENALLDGILLGERGPLPNDMVESFLVTGTVHILAVSGLGTAFIAGLLFLFFRAAQFKRKAAAFLSLIGLGFFVLMTGAHPPACRAGLFSGLALLAILLEKRVRGGTLLMVTGITLAVLNPLVIEDLSFQISFLATAGLMVLAQRLMERFSFIWKPTALLLSATLAAQVSVWCLIVYSFNQLSPYSLLANLLIVPLALFSAAGGFVLILGSFLHPFLGQVFGAACEVPLQLLVGLAKKIAELPGANFIVASPPLEWMMVFHSLLLAAFILFWPFEKPESPSENWKKKEALYLKGRKIIGMAWGLFALISMAWWVLGAAGPQPLRITFLAVGHGNAVVVQSPKGQVLVCDGGKETYGPDRYHPLVAFLRHRGIGRVEDALNTHPDEDHLGGLVNLAWALPIQKMFEGYGVVSNSAIYQTFQKTLQIKGIPLLNLKEGDNLPGFDPAEISILHPAVSYHPRIHADNNRSLVSRVSYGAFSLILPGDLEKDGIEKLLKDHRPFPRVDWLMAPHHGRKTGEPALCAQGLHPRFVVLSDWKDYPEDHKLYQAAVPDAVVLSTAEEGAIEVEVDVDGKGRYRGFRNGEWRNFDGK